MIFVGEFFPYKHILLLQALAPSPANYLKTINPDDISAMNEFFTTLSYGPQEAGQEDEVS